MRDGVEGRRGREVGESVDSYRVLQTDTLFCQTPKVTRDLFLLR